MNQVILPPVADGTYNIAVTLSHASEKAVTVDFVVADGTAIETHDYVVNNASTRLTFANQSVSDKISNLLLRLILLMKRTKLLVLI